jgi:hypothetical protein
MRLPLRTSTFSSHCAPLRGGALFEQLRKPVFALSLRGITTLGRTVTLVAAITLRFTRALPRGSVLNRGCTLNNLVELTAVKPHTSTLGAVVNLDSAAVRHNKGGAVIRAFHIPSLGTKASKMLCVRED